MQTYQELTFEGFPKIPRLSKETMIVTEKLDGTNAQIIISDDGLEMAVASRNRIITPEEDNFGFASWAQENKQELLRLGPGRHFGEWWGAGIQRRYGLDHKRFSLFNTHRWGAAYSAVQEGHENGFPKCCHVVPVLGVSELEDNSEFIYWHMSQLRKDGSVAAPGFSDPEGIIVYLPLSGQMYKRTFDDGHKGVVG